MAIEHPVHGEVGHGDRRRHPEEHGVQHAYELVGRVGEPRVVEEPRLIGDVEHRGDAVLDERRPDAVVVRVGERSAVDHRRGDHGEAHPRRARGTRARPRASRGRAGSGGRPATAVRPPRPPPIRTTGSRPACWPSAPAGRRSAAAPTAARSSGRAPRPPDPSRRAGRAGPPGPSSRGAARRRRRTAVGRRVAGRPGSPRAPRCRPAAARRPVAAGGPARSPRRSPGHRPRWRWPGAGPRGRCTTATGRGTRRGAGRNRRPVRYP